MSDNNHYVKLAEAVVACAEAIVALAHYSQSVIGAVQVVRIVSDLSDALEGITPLSGEGDDD